MCYAQALHLLPEAHAERAVLHSNRAACLMVLRDFAECERECSLALEIDSGFVRAIARRARARELRGRFTLALEDLRRLVLAAVAVRKRRWAPRRWLWLLRVLSAGAEAPLTLVGTPE